MPPEPLDYANPSDGVPRAVARALYIRKVVGVVTLFSLAIAIVNLPDGSRYRLESVGVFVLCLLLYAIAIAWVWGARAEARRTERRQ